MPRSKNIDRYPLEYFQCIEAAARQGEHRVRLPSANDAQSLRLEFYALRRGIEERNFTPYVHYVKDMRFFVEGSDLVIRRGNSALQQSLKDSLTQPSGWLSPPEPGATPFDQASAESNEERVRRLMIEQGIIMPQPQAEAERVRTPDELLSDLLKLKDRK